MYGSIARQLWVLSSHHQLAAVVSYLLICGNKGVNNFVFHRVLTSGLIHCNWDKESNSVVWF